MCSFAEADTWLNENLEPMDAGTQRYWTILLASAIYTYNPHKLHVL